MNSSIPKYIAATAFFAGTLFFVKYLLPLFLPFLLGAALAMAAEPLVAFLSQRLKLRRAFAAGIGISAAFGLLSSLVLLICAFLLRELRNLAGVLPELEQTVNQGLNTADQYLTALTHRIPGELGDVLTRNVDSLFSGSSAVLGRIGDFLLKTASGVLSHVPNGALGFAAGVLSSFMISAKLPKIRRRLTQWLPPAKMEPILSALKRLKTALGGWLKAQLKLSAVTFCLSWVGLFLLGIPRAPLWALGIGLVDAFPILGTGTVLVPWSMLSFLQGDNLLAFGLLALYAVAALSRSILEPKLLGKQLGLDPLITLMALYVGFRLWSIPGMILAPILAVAVAQLVPHQA